MRMLNDSAPVLCSAHRALNCVLAGGALARRSSQGALAFHIAPDCEQSIRRRIDQLAFSTPLQLGAVHHWLCLEHHRSDPVLVVRPLWHEHQDPAFHSASLLHFPAALSYWCLRRARSRVRIYSRNYRCSGSSRNGTAKPTRVCRILFDTFRAILRDFTRDCVHSSGACAVCRRAPVPLQLDVGFTKQCKIHHSADMYQ